MTGGKIGARHRGLDRETTTTGELGHRRLAHARQDGEDGVEGVGGDVDLDHDPPAGLEDRVDEQHQTVDGLSPVRVRQGVRDWRRAESRTP